MNISSFTDEQLLNLVNGTIKKHTEFNENDFTGGSIQVTSTHSNRITNYKVSLFFGYTSKKPITRTIEIAKDSFYIWSKAILLKVSSIENNTVGMDFNELNDLMNNSPKEVVSKEVVSSIVVSRGKDTTPTTTPTTIKSQISNKLDELSPLINIDAFNEWLEYKKYKTIAPITKTINFLCKYDFIVQQQIVDTSIMNNYKGLFEPKHQQSNNKSFKQQDQEQSDREFEAISQQNIFDVIDEMDKIPNEVQGVICE